MYKSGTLTSRFCHERSQYINKFSDQLFTLLLNGFCYKKNCVVMKSVRYGWKKDEHKLKIFISLHSQDILFEVYCHSVIEYSVGYKKTNWNIITHSIAGVNMDKLEHSSTSVSDNFHNNPTSSYNEFPDNQFHNGFDKLT